MKELDLVIGMAPLVGALLFAISWLIQILTRIESRVTKLEVLVSERLPTAHHEGEFHASTP